MGLSSRITTAKQRLPTDERSHIKELIKQRLYEKIPPDGIAHLVSADPMLARRELEIMIASAQRDVMVERAYAQHGERNGERDAGMLTQIKESLLEDILGMGPIETLLGDPKVTEIMVNGTAIFYEEDGRLHRYESSFDDHEHVRLIIDRIISPLGRRLDERTPLVNARLPQGHRVNAVIPPISLTGPLLTIRKFRERIYSLAELTELQTISAPLARFLEWAVKARLNIAVSGGTGSGKTTLLNALSTQISPHERIITIEDSAELRFHEHPHVVSLEARPPSLEGAGEVRIRDLVTNSLRMRPDRIIVGECRAEEALDMLQAMNTGHDGSLTTLHANSPADAITRLSTMIMYAADIPIAAIEQQIFSALDLIVHQERMSSGKRKVTAVASCKEGMRPIFRIDGSQHYSVHRSGIFETLVRKGVATSQEIGEVLA